MIFITIYLFTVDIKKVLHIFRQKKANYSQFDQDFIYLLGLQLKHSKSPLCILKIKFKTFPPIPQIWSALGTRRNSEKLRKLRIKSRQKAWSLFVRVETNLNSTKLAEKWFMTAWQLQELIEIGLFLLRCTSDIRN